MGGLTKPIVINDPTTGKPKTVLPTSTTGLNVTDPGPDPTNVSVVAQATNNPTAFPGITPPPAAPAPAPAAAPPAATPTPAAPTPTPSSALLADPGAYEQWIKQHVGDLDTPTNVETLYGTGGATSTLGNDPLNAVKPTTATQSYEDWLAANASGPSAGASSSVLGSLPTGPSNSSSVYSQASPVLGTPGATEGVYGQESGAYDAPSIGELFQQQYGSDPMQLSDTEKLYNSGIGQLDPYYDYASKRAIQQAQTASAARGSFNSGLAGQQESDILGNLRGQQAQQMFQLAPEADAAKMSRETLGNTEAQDATSDYNTRIQNMFANAEGTDAATLSRLTGLSSIASAGDSADTARNTLRSSTAANADRSAIDAFNATAGAQSTGASLGLDQFTDNTSLATAQSGANRNDLSTLYDIAGAADSSKMGRFTMAGGLEKDLQTTGQDRIAGGLSATDTQSTAEAGLVNQILNDPTAIQGINNMDDTALQALADKYGVTLQEMKDVASAIGTAGGAAISAAGAKK